MLNKSHILRAAVIALAAVGSSHLFAAGDQQAGSANKDMSNVGFVENPPRELKQRFPMCDAFLKVDWIDKQKSVGYTTYDAIVKGRGADSHSERRRVWALVAMEPNPIFTYDLYEYKRDGTLDELFEKIRKGTFQFGGVEYKEERIDFYTIPMSAINEDEQNPLLSNHLQTVCVAYPDEKRAWIVEGKSVKQTYNESQIEGLMKRIKADTGVLIPIKRFELYWVLDVNADGIDDYVLERSYIYSSANRFYMNNVQDEVDVLKHKTTVTFPPSNRKCSLPSNSSRYITTDGKKYYLDHQCNLTELTSSSGE